MTWQIKTVHIWIEGGEPAGHGGGNLREIPQTVGDDTCQ